MPLMDANLSRRAAKVKLPPDQRVDFISALETAGTFDKLPKKYQDMIVAAEGDKTAKKERKWLLKIIDSLEKGD